MPDDTTSEAVNEPAYRTLPAPLDAVPIATWVKGAPVAPQEGNWISAALTAVLVETVQPEVVRTTAIRV